MVALNLKPKRSTRLVAAGLLASLCAVGSLAGTTGASTRSHASSVITLTYWNGVSDMSKSVAMWNKLHPDIQVKLNSTDDVQLLPSAVSAGKAPDVANVSSSEVPDLLIDHDAVNITKYLAKYKDVYTKSMWDEAVYDGQVWGVPEAPGPVVLYYRKDLFAKYHLPVPTTWTQYASEAATLHKDDPQTYITSFTPNFGAWWWGLVNQAKQPMFSIQGNSWVVSLNNSVEQKLASYWQGLLDKKLLLTDQAFTAQYWKDIAQGRIASIVEASWFAKLLETNDPKLAGKWAVVQLPNLSGSVSAADTGGSVDVVLRGTKYPKQAAEFANFINSNPKSVANLVTNGGLYPATRAGLDSSALNSFGKGYFVGTSLKQEFKTASQHTPAVKLSGPRFEQFQSDLEDGLATVANGKKTLATMLDSLQKQMVTLLKQAGLSVVSK